MGTTNSVGQRLRAKWEAGEPAFGLWGAIPSSLTGWRFSASTFGSSGASVRNPLTPAFPAGL